MSEKLYHGWLLTDLEAGDYLDLCAELARDLLAAKQSADVDEQSALIAKLERTCANQRTELRALNSAMLKRDEKTDARVASLDLEASEVSANLAAVVDKFIALKDGITRIHEQMLAEIAQCVANGEQARRDYDVEDDEVAGMLRHFAEKLELLMGGR